jgi:hypothetical protein
MARKTQTPAIRLGLGDRRPQPRQYSIRAPGVHFQSAGAAPLPVPTLVCLQDLLISRDGQVAAVKYGIHAYDQWSVDELLDLAISQGAGPA